MATDTSPPLFPPPPPPPATTHSQSRQQRTLQIPIQSFPKVDSLRYLIQNANPNMDTTTTTDASSPLDVDERRSLRECEEVGSTLVRLMTNCEDYRLQAQLSHDKLRAQHDPQSLRVKQEAALTNYKYSACLSSFACPDRMQMFFHCFRSVDSKVIQELQRHNAVHLLCKSERQAVERCVGELVAKSVRAADETTRAGEVANSSGNEGGTLWWLWDTPEDECKSQQ